MREQGGKTVAVSCNNVVNYATVEASPALPFVFTLDEDNSVLFPEEGESQRFCYRVQGVGADTSAYADLSHFVLGACDTLTEDDILAAEVIIDGMPQTVVIGDNVSVLTEDAPDPTTGCAGIKIDFGLRKDGGVMVVCFTLRRVFAIGPVDVCVKGGTTELGGMAICGPACGGLATCGDVVTQRMSVCVPVTVTPWARAGAITAECCGEPVLTPGTAVCPGDEDASCSFTISQQLCMQIPLYFGATAVPGTPRADCEGVETGLAEGEARVIRTGERMSGGRISGARCRSRRG